MKNFVLLIASVSFLCACERTSPPPPYDPSSFSISFVDRFDNDILDNVRLFGIDRWDRYIIYPHIYDIKFAINGVKISNPVQKQLYYTIRRDIRDKKFLELGSSAVSKYYFDNYEYVDSFTLECSLKCMDIFGDESYHSIVYEWSMHQAAAPDHILFDNKPALAVGNGDCTYTIMLD